MERLSTDELIGLAEGYGLEIPAGLDRIFIIEELMYLGHNGNGKAESYEAHGTLPRLQTVSTVEVIVRDPLWAFVFWEIKGNDKEMYENIDEFEGYCLRVIPLNENNHCPDMSASFSVAVGKKDSAWYVGFPPDGGCLFVVELCVSRWENIIVLATSRPFRMPRLIEPRRNEDGQMQAVYRNPLVQLSGADRFPLLRNMDRLLRPRSE